MRDSDFLQRYGPWAVVAGAASGLGLAYARELARRGCDLVMVDVDERALKEAADRIAPDTGVQVRAVHLDLARPDVADVLAPLLAELDVGLLVLNAAHEPIGEFHSTDLGDLLRAVDVNVRTPVRLIHMLVPGLLRRGRGGILVMSSLAANRGSGLLATYAATKAFQRVLAESLWEELGRRDVDVLVVAAGTIDTPNYRASGARGGPPPSSPELVARSALDALGGRSPVMTPGLAFRLSAPLVRLLPVPTAVRMMSRMNRRMFRA